MSYLLQGETTKLLGRSLTATETKSFDMWEQIAEARLSNLLCVNNLAELVEKLGVETLPVELKLVLARFFGAIAYENGVEIGVTSKKVEDFSINYDNDELKNVFANVVTANGDILRKYSQCFGIRSGRTLKEEAKYYHHDRF